MSHNHHKTELFGLIACAARLLRARRGDRRSAQPHPDGQSATLSFVADRTGTFGYTGETGFGG